MKAKILGALFGLILAGVGAYVALAHLSGGAFPTPGLTLGGARGELRRTTLSFWEDLQFKDFEKAASYHAADRQAEVDIPYLIERLFLQKPELLDFMSYEVVMVDLDTSELRARVKSRVKVKDLLREDIRERELMLYYKRDDERSPWTMDLESSLRQIEAEEGKKR